MDVVKECPACKSNSIASIWYGLVEFTDELQQSRQAGRVKLGGCVITSESPIWHCNECGLEGGRVDLSHSPRPAPVSWKLPLLVFLGCELVLAPIFLGVAYLTLGRPLLSMGIWLVVSFFCVCLIPLSIGRCSRKPSDRSDPTRSP